MARTCPSQEDTKALKIENCSETKAKTPRKWTAKADHIAGSPGAAT
jgi:hypothetical protein